MLFSLVHRSHLADRGFAKTQATSSSSSRRFAQRRQQTRLRVGGASEGSRTGDGNVDEKSESRSDSEGTNGDAWEEADMPADIRRNGPVCDLKEESGSSDKRATYMGLALLSLRISQPIRRSGLTIVVLVDQTTTIRESPGCAVAAYRGKAVQSNEARVTSRRGSWGLTADNRP